MTIQRMDNVLIVVDDLEAAKAFFVELGMELEGETTVEGDWVGRVVGLDDVRADITMMRTPDGHSRVELTKFHTPPAVRAEPENAPANALGIRRIMFAVDDIDDVVARLHSHGAELLDEIAQYEDKYRLCFLVALRASSSDWPSSSAETSMGRPLDFPALALRTARGCSRPTSDATVLRIRGLGASWRYGAGLQGSKAIPSGTLRLVA